LRHPEHPAVSLALDIFGPAGIGASVRDVAKRVGLSQRRFIQVFTAQIGLTPMATTRATTTVRRTQNGSSRIEASIALVDDRSHDRPSRRQRDNFVNALFAQIGIRLIRFPTNWNYCRDSVSAHIASEEWLAKGYHMHVAGSLHRTKMKGNKP
jgi:hypothetical protein